MYKNIIVILADIMERVGKIAIYKKIILFRIRDIFLK